MSNQKNGPEISAAEHWKESERQKASIRFRYRCFWSLGYGVQVGLYIHYLSMLPPMNNRYWDPWSVLLFFALSVAIFVAVLWRIPTLGTTPGIFILLVASFAVQVIALGTICWEYSRLGSAKYETFVRDGLLPATVVLTLISCTSISLNPTFENWKIRFVWIAGSITLFTLTWFVFFFTAVAIVFTN